MPKHNLDIPEGKTRHGMRYVCMRYGKDGKPANPATIHRAINRGNFPPPDKINGQNSWTDEVLDSYDAQLRADAEERAKAAA